MTTDINRLSWWGWTKAPRWGRVSLPTPTPPGRRRGSEVGLLQARKRRRFTRCRLRSDSGRSRSAAGHRASGSRDGEQQEDVAGGGTYLADGGQFGQQHLEDGRRQRLLQHLQQLLRLAAHGDGVGQVVHASLVVSW